MGSLGGSGGSSAVSFFLTSVQSRFGASGAEGLSGAFTMAPSPIRSMDSTGLAALMGRTGTAPEAPVEYKSAPWGRQIGDRSTGGSCMTVALVGERTEEGFIPFSFTYYGKKKGKLSPFLPIATN